MQRRPFISFLFFFFIAVFAVAHSAKADILYLSKYEVKNHPGNPTWIDVEASGNSTYINSLGANTTGNAYAYQVTATENARIQNSVNSKGGQNKIEHVSLSDNSSLENNGGIVNQTLTINDQAKAYNHGRIGTVELNGGKFHHFTEGSVTSVNNNGGTIYNNGRLTHVNLNGPDAALTQTHKHSGSIFNLHVNDGASLDTSLYNGTVQSVSINSGGSVDFFVSSAADFTKIFFIDNGISGISTLYMNKGSSINVDFSDFFLNDPSATSFDLAGLFAVYSNNRITSYDYMTFFRRNGNGYYNFIGLEDRIVEFDDVSRSIIHFSEKPAATPEPGTFVIFSLMGAAGLGLRRYRHKRSAS